MESRKRLTIYSAISPGGGGGKYFISMTAVAATIACRPAGPGSKGRGEQMNMGMNLGREEGKEEEEGNCTIWENYRKGSIPTQKSCWKNYQRRLDACMHCNYLLE